MPAALFLSPHLDDVAFSCGGTFHLLAARGWDTTLCTVFTRSVSNPVGFALACQLDKGLAPPVDYLALRRIEDEAAAAVLGATRLEHLDLPEAPHRGYENAAALFGAYAGADAVAAELGAFLKRRLDVYDVIFAPQALGDHVDHRRVRDAVVEHAARGDLADRIVWYRDTPYAIRAAEALPDACVEAAYPVTVAFELDEAALQAKLNACAAYRSQLDFQFGGAAAMQPALRSFALAEGERSGVSGFVENVRATARAAGRCDVLRGALA